jgi:hypothetical protein
LLLLAIEFLGVLVLEKGSLDWQKLEDRRLGERLGAPAVLVYGTGKETGPEIVVHIPRNLGGGEASLTESSSGRSEFKLSHIRFDWLKFGWVAVASLFGSDTVWPELPNESSKVYS